MQPLLVPATWDCPYLGLTVEGRVPEMTPSAVLIDGSTGKVYCTISVKGREYWCAEDFSPVPDRDGTPLFTYFHPRHTNLPFEHVPLEILRMEILLAARIHEFGRDWFATITNASQTAWQLLYEKEQANERTY